mgnify:CR=1 FL=1
MTRTEEIQRLIDYLQEQVSINALTEATAKRALDVWNLIDASMNRRVQVPDACPSPDDMLLYSWNKGALHFEAEFPANSDTLVEFFFINHENDETWQQDIEYTPELADLPAPVKAHFGFFLY